jgi:hypothetical protein
MRDRRHLLHIAAAAGILLVPLAMLIVALVIRTDTLTAFRHGLPAAVDLNLDAETAVRWTVVLALLAVAGLVGWMPVRRRVQARAEARDRLGRR